MIRSLNLAPGSKDCLAQPFHITDYFEIHHPEIGCKVTYKTMTSIVAMSFYQFDLCINLCFILKQKFPRHPAIPPESNPLLSFGVSMFRGKSSPLVASSSYKWTYNPYKSPKING